MAKDPKEAENKESTAGTEEVVEVDSIIEGRAEADKPSPSADESVSTDSSNAARDEATNETTSTVVDIDAAVDNLIEKLTTPDPEKAEEEPAETAAEDEQVTIVDIAESSSDTEPKTSEEEVAEIAEVDSEQVTVVEGHPTEPSEASEVGEDNDRQDPLATAKKKKSKAPLIIFLCLLLCAIAGAVTWLILRSTPEAQVTDAITNLMTAKQISTTGSINLKFDEDANPDVRSAKLDLGITSDHIPTSTSATLSVTTQNNSTFKIDLGEAIARDGTIYIKVSGLKKAIDSAKVPEEVQTYLDYFEDVIIAADDQWWMIAIPDLLDQISDTLSTELDSSYADVYQCIFDQVANNDGSELANLYRQYPFIDVANYTGTQLQPVANGTLFSISVNGAKLTSFQNELAITAYQKELQRCIAQISTDDSTDIEYFYKEQVDGTIDSLANLPPAYVEVTGFDHKLARFYYDYESDDLDTFEIDLRFAFPSTISVDMPTKARAITELIDAIVDDFNYMLYDIYGSYYTYTDCDSVDNCTSDVILN